ncbi:MAG: hypothetical protein GY863_01710 [bacterium]|nr:hypothetical protein [bacterium]
MENPLLLQELENLATKLDITVRYEEGDFRTGICRVKDEQLLLVNKKLPEEQKIRQIAAELGKLDLSNIYILPQLREKISNLADQE